VPCPTVFLRDFFRHIDAIKEPYTPPSTASAPSTPTSSAPSSTLSTPTATPRTTTTTTTTTTMMHFAPLRRFAADAARIRSAQVDVQAQHFLVRYRIVYCSNCRRLQTCCARAQLTSFAFAPERAIMQWIVARRLVVLREIADNESDVRTRGLCVNYIECCVVSFLFLFWAMVLVEIAEPCQDESRESNHVHKQAPSSTTTTSTSTTTSAVHNLSNVNAVINLLRLVSLQCVTFLFFGSLLYSFSWRICLTRSDLCDANTTPMRH
jgi:hypothetical protein